MTTILLYLLVQLSINNTDEASLQYNDSPPMVQNYDDGGSGGWDDGN